MVIEAMYKETQNIYQGGNVNASLGLFIECSVCRIIPKYANTYQIFVNIGPERTHYILVVTYFGIGTVTRFSHFMHNA